MGIYQIRNLENGKLYIGSAKYILGRYRKHIRDLNRGNHHSIKLQRAWNKYGERCFIFEIIEEIKEEIYLIPREQFWLDYHRSYMESGYNMSPTAGSTLGKKISEKTSKAISEANRCRIWSEESIRRARQSQLDRDPKTRDINYKHTEESKKKMSEASKGKSKSKEHRERISKALKGKKRTPLSQDRKDKIRAQHLGVKRSDETKKKISEAIRGKKRSEESKRKMREAWKLRRLCFNDSCLKQESTGSDTDLIITSPS